jgi:hypothetical protein
MKNYKYSIVELTLGCSKCSKAIFINGPVKRALCNSCQHEHELPLALWRTIFSDIEWVREESKEGKGKKSVYTSSEGLELNWLSGNLKPYCTQCKTDFQSIKENPGDDTWNITCKNCKKETSVVSPFEWVKELCPNINLILNADINEPDGVLEKPAIKPVIFSCPGCKGNLDIDGRERLITCKYCNSNLYLPDDLWLRFHPARTVKRWMIGFERK